MKEFQETFKGNNAVTQGLLEAGALAGGTFLGSVLLNSVTPTNITTRQALVTSSALAVVGAIHGFAKGREAEAQFNEQNSLITEAVHKGYIEQDIEKVSHKVR